MGNILKLQQIRESITKTKSHAVKLFLAAADAIEELDQRLDGMDPASSGVPSFDNLLAYPGCKRITPPKTGSTWTEQIVTKEGGLLRAQRVTVITAEDDITETYTLYGEDGTTMTAKYVVYTTKDETETWTEDVTQEGVSE